MTEVNVKYEEFSNISMQMKEHIGILGRIAGKYPDTEVYRLSGTRSNMVVLYYNGKRVCGLVSDKKGIPCGTLGTRIPLESDAKNALEIKGGYKNDPEPQTLTTRYRYRKGWGHPYTLCFDSYEAMEAEVEKLIKHVM